MQSTMVVSPPTGYTGVHKELGKVQEAVWPDACPSKYEDHVLSIVCGNTHLQWALHQGIHGKFLPQLFWRRVNNEAMLGSLWLKITLLPLLTYLCSGLLRTALYCTVLYRTPALTSDEIAAGDPCTVLERYLPSGGHDLVFGSQTAAADKAQAAKASAARRIPLLSVYLVSTNADNEAGVEFLFRDIPCRMHRLQATDFYALEDGVYPGMGIDRLANLRAASTFYPYPVMVIDGGTALTYTAADAKGKIVGGGIFPGFASIYRALFDYTGALPLIAQEELNNLIFEAIASKTPLSLFATDTKSAMITTGIKAMAEVCWGAVQEFKDKLLKDAAEDDGGENGENGPSEHVFTICLTGGDGDIIARLLDVDHNGILSSNVPAGARDGVDIQKHKHLAHYGIGQVLDEKTNKAQTTKSDDDKIREEVIGQRVAKEFKIRTGEKIYRGSVAAVADNETLEKDWFFVRYDDGDTEHLSITALYGTFARFV
jgi:pantothenate kinase type III